MLYQSTLGYYLLSTYLRLSLSFCTFCVYAFLQLYLCTCIYTFLCLCLFSILNVFAQSSPITCASHIVYFLVFVFVFFFYIIYFINTSLCSCFWSAFAQSSPITCASHSCLDWKGNPRPHPIPQTHSCVPDDYDNYFYNHSYHNYHYFV